MGLVISSLGGQALAQSGDSESPPAESSENLRKAQSIARRTMSPFCPGRTLSDCPSDQAAAWRRDIQQMLDRGDSPQQIQEELERRAGGDLSGSPHRGAGYGLPIGLGVLALGVLFGLLRWLRAGRETTATTPRDSRATLEPTTTDAALDERLDQELSQELDEDDEDER